MKVLKTTISGFKSINQLCIENSDKDSFYLMLPQVYYINTENLHAVYFTSVEF